MNGAGLNASRPLPVIDCLLAATAKVHHMTLVTRDIAEIADLDVQFLNPFEPRYHKPLRSDNARYLQIAPTLNGKGALGYNLECRANN